MYVREFLNLRGEYELAAIVAEVPDDLESGEATLRISDCNRSVSLDFDESNKRGRRNSLRKARLLRDTLIAFADALEERLERVAVREKLSRQHEASPPPGHAHQRWERHDNFETHAHDR